MESYLSYYSKKRILITGGGGYLGSKLAEVLSATDADIFLLDIKFNSIAEELVDKKPNVIKLISDLTCMHEMEESIKASQPDIVFHFGALLYRERDFINYDQLYKVNVEGTLNLLENLKSVDYEGFYYASSSEVYGNKNPSPFREDQNPIPASPYSLTKLMAEQLISTFSQINNKPYSIFRLFNFYGPNMPPNFFLSQLENALRKNVLFEMTPGEQIRDYLYIDDLISYILRVASTYKSRMQIVNMCSGNATSIKELAIKVAKQHNKLHLLKIGALPYRANEIWEMLGDVKNLQSLLQSK